MSTQSQALKQISLELCKHERQKNKLEEKRTKCKLTHQVDFLNDEIKKIKTEMRICLNRMAALNKTILASLAPPPRHALSLVR
jgi:uncharacterized coiled-coil protein SlyX